MPHDLTQRGNPQCTHPRQLQDIVQHHLMPPNPATQLHSYPDQQYHAAGNHRQARHMQHQMQITHTRQLYQHCRKNIQTIDITEYPHKSVPENLILAVQIQKQRHTVQYQYHVVYKLQDAHVRHQKLYDICLDHTPHTDQHRIQPQPDHAMIFPCTAVSRHQADRDQDQTNDRHEHTHGNAKCFFL